LTIDGVGEWATATYGVGKENKITIIKQINFPHSLGLLYSAFTYYLGFKVNSAEYKVMGLAPYGKPVYYNLIMDKLIEVKDDGSFKIGDNSGTIVTHPHCYATEGLLYAYHTLERRELLEAARKSGAWLAKAQNSDGSFYLSYDGGKKTEREKVKATDSTAQATRIWKLLGINRDGIEKAYTYLENERNDKGLRVYKIEPMRTSVHSWPTFFYMHSLMMPFGEMEYCRELF
jgi:hypothetical protein